MCWVPSSQMTDRLSVALRAGHYSARAISSNEYFKPSTSLILTLLVWYVALAEANIRRLEGSERVLLRQRDRGGTS